MEHEALYHINFPVSKELLLDEAMSFDDYQPYHDAKNNRYLDDWLQKHVTEGLAWDLAQKYKTDLDLGDIRPRYYIQKSGFTLPWHKDRGTECSFNFVLDGTSSISFRDGDFYYESAILNTQVEHAVFQTEKDTDRVLLKFSVFDLSFDEVVKRYQLKYM